MFCLCWLILHAKAKAKVDEPTLPTVFHGAQVANIFNIFLNCFTTRMCIRSVDFSFAVNLSSAIEYSFPYMFKDVFISFTFKILL